MASQIGSSPYADSAMLANPALQYPNEGLVEELHKGVKEVVLTQKDNFNPGKEKLISTVLAVLSAVAFAIAGVAFGVLHATGVGVAVTGIALLVGGLACYSWSVAADKVKEEEKVGKVYDHASFHRIGRTFQKHDPQTETLERARGPRAYRPQVRADDLNYLRDGRMIAPRDYGAGGFRGVDQSTQELLIV